MLVALPQTVGARTTRPEYLLPLEHQGEELQKAGVFRRRLRRRVGQRDKKVFRGELQRTVGILPRPPWLEGLHPTAGDEAFGPETAEVRLQNVEPHDLERCPHPHQVAGDARSRGEGLAGHGALGREGLQLQIHPACRYRRVRRMPALSNVPIQG